MIFSTNLSTASITNDNGFSVSFCPRDVNFVSDVYDLAEDIRKKLEEQPPENKQDVFRIARERDAWARERMDAIFGDGTSLAFFGRVNLWTVTDMGTPIITNFLMAVIEEVDKAASTKVDISPKLQEFVSKYEGKYGNV